VSRREATTLATLWRCLPVALTIAALLPAAAWAQQEERVVRPTDAIRPPARASIGPSYEDGAVTMVDAVAYTLDYNPRIQREKQEVAFYLGVVQETGGLFDHNMRIAPTLVYDQHALFPFLRKQEEDKRIRMEVLRDEFRELHTQLTRQLAEIEANDQETLDFRPPRCPEGLDNLIIVGLSTSELARRELSQRTGLDTADAFGRNFTTNTAGGGVVDFFSICTPRSEGHSQQGTLLRMSELMGKDLGDALINSVEASTSTIALAHDIADLVATKAGLSRQRLAEVPEIQTRKSVSLDLGYFKSLRNGVTFSGALALSASEQNFLDKSLDPAFGGLGVPNSYPNSVSFTLDVPLGKGRGAVSAAAPERAAQSTLRARQERLRHAIAEEVFGTIVAYVNLVGAEESLGLVEESARRQDQMVQTTQQLVNAGDLAQTDLDRVRARQTTVYRAASNGRLAVLDARLVLAQAMGISIDESSDAPLAADGFPDVLMMPRDLGDLVSEAVDQRRDLKAVTHSRNASKLLADAAQSDLKRNIDLSFSAGMSTLYESPFYKVFPEELDEPTESPLHWYSPRGVYRAWDAKWSPFIKVGLTFDLPFGNNVAEGQLLQRRSQLRSSEISLTDLERIIVENVVSVTGALNRAREAVNRRRENVVYSQRTLDSTLQLYTDGEIDLISTLSTEEDLTTARIELARALQVYTGLLARLNFEAGALVTFSQVGTATEEVEFENTDLVGQR